MQNNPLVNSLSELLVKIKRDIEKNEIDIYINNKKNNQSLFEKLLVQELVREIDGNNEVFLAIRSIVLKKEMRNQGLLTFFLEELEKLNINIMFHDVINNELAKFLEKRDYLHLFEIKSEHPVNSLYKMKRIKYENESSASIQR